MDINKVSKIRFDDEVYVYINLLHGNLKLMLPKSWVVTQRCDGEFISRLHPGDKFTILQNKYAYNIAYVYDGHLYVLDLPKTPKESLKAMPVLDRAVLDLVLRRELFRSGQIPCWQTWKNLQCVLESQKSR